ncbi:DMT family transporter [bacterium]|nr:DMT family transporter [bacterium]
MQNKEKIGTLFILIHAVMWGIFPVLVNHGVKNIPPLTYAALTILLATIGAFFYALIQGKLSDLKNKNSYKSLLMITLCIVIIPYSLFFWGASLTSGVNTSVLLLSEIIFTLIFTHFIGEKTTGYKLMGAGGVFFGALFILYNGTLNFNIGDLIIIISTITYPIGNLYAKRVLNLVSPSIILFTRFLLGGLFILGLALLIEPQANIGQIINNHWLLIVFNGLVLLGIGKVIWYEGLKRIDISKAISLSSTFPLFSLIILLTIFKESISLYQGIGIIIMMLGVYFSVKRKSVDPQLTKYANK